MATSNADVKGKSKKPKAAASGTSAPSGDDSDSKLLRRLDHAFVEVVHEPLATGRAYLAAVLSSLGAVGLGAGVYALVVLEGRPLYAYAPYVIVLGILAIGVSTLLGPSGHVVHVGELGVSVIAAGRAQRTAWHEIQSVSLTDGELRLATKEGPIALGLPAHRLAAAHIAREALRRIPKRVTLSDEEVRELGDVDTKKRVAAEPPQVTNSACRATKKPLTIEKDVRLCARCGVAYHRASVPRRCLECDAQLKSA